MVLGSNKELYYLYILKSEKDGRFYTGVTNNLERRITEHNKGNSKYYKTRGPFQLVYFEEYSTRSEAMKREYHLKSLEGGSLKKKLVDNFDKNLLKMGR